MVLTKKPVVFSKIGIKTSRSPESWVLVVVDKITVLVWAKTMDDPIKINKETNAHKMILVPIIRFMFYPPY
jgi:hypothetical protein